ncbi:hypothetical protein [Ursidibacter arcticus]
MVDKSRIKQMIFGHFKKCLYPLQKFDSDTERRFAVILERDAQKWFKPTKGQFQISYKLDGECKEYLPDFVIETDNCILMAETKAETAREWCKYATDYALKNHSKRWHYLLIPHNEVIESKKLVDFLRFEKG